MPNAVAASAANPKSSNHRSAAMSFRRRTAARREKADRRWATAAD